MALVPALEMNADKAKTVLDLKSEITDSDIIYPESYEIDTQKMLEGWYLKNYTATDDRYKTQSDVEASDEVRGQSYPYVRHCGFQGSEHVLER